MAVKEKMISVDEQTYLAIKELAKKQRRTMRAVLAELVKGK